MLETRDGMFLRVPSVQAFTENVSWERGRGDKGRKIAVRIRVDASLGSVLS